MRVISPSNFPSRPRWMATTSTRSPFRALAVLRWLTKISFSSPSTRTYIEPLAVMSAMPSKWGRCLCVSRYFSRAHSSTMPSSCRRPSISNVSRRPSFVAPPEADARCLSENLLLGNSRKRLRMTAARSVFFAPLAGRFFCDCFFISSEFGGRDVSCSLCPCRWPLRRG